jgi:hypothetical protein
MTCILNLFTYIIIIGSVVTERSTEWGNVTMILLFSWLIFLIKAAVYIERELPTAILFEWLKQSFRCVGFILFIKLVYQQSKFQYVDPVNIDVFISIILALWCLQAATNTSDLFMGHESITQTKLFWYLLPVFIGHLLVITYFDIAMIMFVKGGNGKFM